MINYNVVKHNLLDWTSTFCPYLYNLLKDNEVFWTELATKFSLKLNAASAVIASEGKIKTENSLPVLLGKAFEGQQIFVSFLAYIDEQIKFLYETAPAELKSKTIELFRRLFSEFDIEEQHKPNPTYLNGLSEILIVNKLIESGEYTLVQIEEPLGNGKNTDFTLVKKGESEKKYVEVVNIHVNTSKVEHTEGFKLFMDARLTSKYNDKTVDLSKEVLNRFHLAPCVWSDDSVSHFLEEYGSINHLKELRILPPCSLVQYTNGDKKGFHFGIIKAEDL